MFLLINHDMKVINGRVLLLLYAQEFSNLITKIIRDLIYEQKLLTQQQIMALCPFDISRKSVDKEIIGTVKFC